MSDATERCKVCDRAECPTAAAAAETARLTIPVTPGQNGCDCYGTFSRSHNPSRGCKVHSEQPALEAAWDTERAARADCNAHVHDWRAEALRLRPVAEAAVAVRIYTEDTSDGRRCVEPEHEAGECVDCDFLRAVDTYRTRKP
jgi:hypothetical protein